MRSSTDVARLDDGRVVLGDRLERAVGEVVADRVRQDEVAVGQALHQRRGAEAVGAVVGEVGLAGHEQSGDRRLQVVVDPQAAHDVVHGRVDPHRHRVRVLAGDPGVHVEEVAVLVGDGVAGRGARSRRRSRGRHRVVRRRPRARRRDPRRRRSSRPARRCRGGPGCRRRGRSAPGSSRGPPRRSRAGPSRSRPGSSAPRCGRRCAATPTSASAWTGASPRPGCRSGGSACSRGWPCRRPCGARATRR